MYLQMAQDKVMNCEETINEGDFLIILIAVVQSGSVQIQDNFLKA